jgi:hypothetical protein
MDFSCVGFGFTSQKFFLNGPFQASGIGNSTELQSCHILVGEA